MPHRAAGHRRRPPVADPRRRRRAPAWVAGIVAIVVGSSLVGPSLGAMPGRSADPEEVATLAREAIDDPAALEELHSIDEVDGRPVDLAAVTAELGDGAERARRLESIARLFDEPAPGDDGAAERARAEARDVLDGDAYRRTEPPRPFRGVVRWVGERLEPLVRLLGDVFGPIWRAIVAVPFLGVALVVALAMAAAIWTSRAVAARGVASDGSPAGRYLVDPDADPAVLDAEAEAAEAAGDLDLAVRRRFEAGLIRLVRVGRLELRLETTAERAAAEVGGVALGELAATFQEVTYGGRRATADDVEAARARWPEVLGARAAR